MTFLITNLIFIFRHNKASKIKKKTLQAIKLIGMGFDTSEKPFGGELEVFEIEDIEALGYTITEARNIHFKLLNGNKAVSVPDPMHKHNYKAPEMAARNNRVRLFLEQDEYSDISYG